MTTTMTTTTTTTLGQVYKTVSGYFRPSAAPTQPSIQPVIINLPEKTNNVLFSYSSIAAFIESSKEIKYYDCTTGKLEQTFKCSGNVTKMIFNPGKLFAVCGEEGPIQAWELFSGNPIQLPETWKKVSNLLISVNFFILGQPGTVENSPMNLLICDPYTYEVKRKISTEYFKIHDMVYKVGFLFVTGIENNPANKEAPKNSFLMRYNKLDESAERCKLNLEYDSEAVIPDVLRITSSFIYNAKWTPSVNCVWDFNTLSTVLARKAEKSSKMPTLTKVSDYTVIVADQKQIVIYDVENEEQIEPPTECYVARELGFEITYGTKMLGKARKIEFQKGDPLKSFRLFKISDEKVMAEGYASGKVIIRNLKSLNKMMEFVPPGNLSNACTLKVNYNGDKLLVHYGQTSDGTLAIVWDLVQQKPILSITREALKNRNYDSSQDVLYYNQGNIAIQSEDQVLFYKDGMV